jgi:hypothetical protein
VTSPALPGKKIARQCLIVAAIALLGVAQALFQSGFERRNPYRHIENLLYLPKGGHLKEMSLGYQTVLADILWMKAISYFGGHNLTDQEYPWLFHILDQTTSLDPLFHHAYTFGGVVLAVEGDSIAQSIALLRKGMDYFPGDWILPFYIGLDSFYYLKDPVVAADYIKVAATLPGHPEYLPRLAASLLSRSGRLPAAIAFLTTVAENTEDEWVRQGLYRKIEELKAGIIPKRLEGFLSGSGGQR